MMCFFFQAEDGIRDIGVTGVQTCALPILTRTSVVMDSHNLFLTRVTYRLVRAEYAVALGVSIVLALLHLGDIRWWAFALLFPYIDVIGYWPGAVAWRVAKKAPISRAYFVLYNVMHSLVSAAAVAGLW